MGAEAEHADDKSNESDAKRDTYANPEFDPRAVVCRLWAGIS